MALYEIDAERCILTSVGGGFGTFHERGLFSAILTQSMMIELYLKVCIYEFLFLLCSREPLALWLLGPFSTSTLNYGQLNESHLNATPNNYNPCEKRQADRGVIVVYAQ
jgi:hypothetical protein